MSRVRLRKLGYADRWATPREVAALRAAFLRRLAVGVLHKSREAWLLALPNHRFVNRVSGFQAEFRRLGRLAARAIRELATREGKRR